MSFRIVGLDPADYHYLWSMSGQELESMSAIRTTVDESPGFPDRISLDDAEIGSEVILLNHSSQTADTPFRASHAIFVQEGATQFDEVSMLPPAMLRRPQSLRAFDKNGMMCAADIAEGIDIVDLIERLFDDPKVAEIHAHNARQGCFLARVTRA